MSRSDFYAKIYDLNYQLLIQAFFKNLDPSQQKST